jgi:hypothetical protein
VHLSTLAPGPPKYDVVVGGETGNVAVRAFPTFVAAAAAAAAAAAENFSLSSSFAFTGKTEKLFSKRVVMSS